MESMGLPNIFEDVLDEGISIGEARGRSEVCASIRSQLIAGGMSPQEADRYVQLALADLNLSNQ